MGCNLPTPLAGGQAITFNGSQASDVGSIPIARSITPVDAVGLTGFPPRIWPLRRPILDAVGRDLGQGFLCCAFGWLPPTTRFCRFCHSDSNCFEVLRSQNEPLTSWSRIRIRKTLKCLVGVPYGKNQEIVCCFDDPCNPSSTERYEHSGFDRQRSLPACRFL